MRSELFFVEAETDERRHNMGGVRQDWLEKHRHQRSKRCTRSISQSHKSGRRWGRSLRGTDTLDNCRRRMSCFRRAMRSIRYVTLDLSTSGIWWRTQPQMHLTYRVTEHTSLKEIQGTFLEHGWYLYVSAGDDELLETTTPRPEVLSTRRRSSSEITKEFHFWFPWGNYYPLLPSKLLLTEFTGSQLIVHHRLFL